MRLDVHERDAEVARERLHDLLGLVLAQQEAVVDEDARELVADRLVHQQRRHGRVDAARQGAEHALGADGGPDPLDLLLDHRGRRPGGGAPATSYRKFLRMSWPCGVCTTSGWNWTPYKRRRGSSNAAIGVDGDRRHRRAARRCGDESRWLIHTTCSEGRSRKSPSRTPRARPCRTRTRPCARRRRRGPAPSAASRSRSRAGHAEREDRLVDGGCPSAYTRRDRRRG